MTHWDPNDPFSSDPDSPDSPYFPYGHDDEIVATIWYLEVVRRIQKASPLQAHDDDAAEMVWIIHTYGDVLRWLIERDLKQMKEQFGRCCE